MREWMGRILDALQSVLVFPALLNVLVPRGEAAEQAFVQHARQRSFALRVDSIAVLMLLLHAIRPLIPALPQHE